MTPFDFVKDVSFNKHGIFAPENEDAYIPIIVNRAFSYYFDTILYSNEMNKYPRLPKKLQYDFYLHVLRKRKRYTPWHKKIEDHELDCISQCYQYSRPRAKEARKLLSREQIADIVAAMDRKNEEGKEVKK